MLLLESLSQRTRLWRIYRFYRRIIVFTSLSFACNLSTYLITSEARRDEWKSLGDPLTRWSSFRSIGKICDDRVIGFISFLQYSLESIPIRNHCCSNVIARPLRRLGCYLDRFQESPKSVVARRDWTSPLPFWFLLYIAIARHIGQTCVRNGKPELSSCKSCLYIFDTCPIIKKHVNVSLNHLCKLLNR